MLVVLLNALTDLANQTVLNSSSPTPPPCDSFDHHYIHAPTASNLFSSLLSCLITALVVLLPLYKTFKAFESRRIDFCQAMLAYWSAMAVIGVARDITNEMAGKYLNYFFYQAAMTVVRLLPTIIGPERLYGQFVRPFFVAHEQQFDTIIKEANDKAHEVMAATDVKGKVAVVKDTLTAVGTTIKDDIASIEHSIAEKVNSVLHPNDSASTDSHGADGYSIAKDADGGIRQRRVNVAKPYSLAGPTHSGSATTTTSTTTSTSGTIILKPGGSESTTITGGGGSGVPMAGLVDTYSHLVDKQQAVIDKTYHNSDSDATEPKEH